MIEKNFDKQDKSVQELLLIKEQEDHSQSQLFHQSSYGVVILHSQNSCWSKALSSFVGQSSSPKFLSSDGTMTNQFLLVIVLPSFIGNNPCQSQFFHSQSSWEGNFLGTITDRMANLIERNFDQVSIYSIKFPFLSLAIVPKFLHLRYCQSKFLLVINPS